MRGAAAALIAFAEETLAHPGHGAPEGHLHAWGIEHGLLFAVIVLLLIYSIKKN